MMMSNSSTGNMQQLDYVPSHLRNVRGPSSMSSSQNPGYVNTESSHLRENMAKVTTLFNQLKQNYQA